MENGNPITYEERKAAKFVFSFSHEDVENADDLVCCSCGFYGLNKTDDHIFSITERDDKLGFGVNMVGVIVVPSSYLCIDNPPKWLLWLIQTFVHQNTVVPCSIHR